MLIILVWMALQALEATQNNLVIWNPGIMADIIVLKDICRGISFTMLPGLTRANWLPQEEEQ